MIILGLNHGEINSSAALLVDGKIVAAAPEERFSRVKRTRAFPAGAIAFCLRKANITLPEVDYVAQAWNPGASWIRFNPHISGHRVKREDYFYTVPDNLMRGTTRETHDWVLMNFGPGASLPPTYFLTHHRAHLGSAFFLSPFEEAALLTCDFRGEVECTTFAAGNHNQIKVNQAQLLPHSLGMFYATYTELLGYEPDSDEWKVMALSAFDVECEDLYRKIRSTIRFADNGLIEVDQSFYKVMNVAQPGLYTTKLVELLGGKEGRRGDVPTEWHCAVARAMQKVSEDIAVHFLKYLHEQTRLPRVALSGGFFMNCVFNGKVTSLTPFEEVSVPYAPADVGNSIGAALYVAHAIHDERREYNAKISYLGPAFTDDQISQVLARRKITAKRLAHVEQDVARMLYEGKIVAHFDGEMEFGERALGNRSILADPRRADTKDLINSMIKYREAYRPFAPAVTAESAHEFFDVPAGYESNHMEKVANVREAYRGRLPAVTHVDGSARLQTVRPEHNRRFHSILVEFGKLAGFPVLLNTSFNVNGEPIVLSPDDALGTFFNSGLEYLVVGSFLVEK